MEEFKFEFKIFPRVLLLIEAFIFFSFCSGGFLASIIVFLNCLNKEMFLELCFPIIGGITSILFLLIFIKTFYIGYFSFVADSIRIRNNIIIFEKKGLKIKEILFENLQGIINRQNKIVFVFKNSPNHYIILPKNIFYDNGVRFIEILSQRGVQIQNKNL